MSPDECDFKNKHRQVIIDNACKVICRLMLLDDNNKDGKQFMIDPMYIKDALLDKVDFKTDGVKVVCPDTGKLLEL